MGQVNAPELAKQFRTLMFGILIAIIFNIAAIIVNRQPNPSTAVSGVILLVGIGISIFLVIQVIKTTRALGWGTGAMVACAIAMFVPCVSLIVLLIINQAAVKALKAAGYQVGLMGARQ